MRILLLMLLAIASSSAQERRVEPTWLYRDWPALREQHLDVSTASCHYVPIFGEADSEARLPKSISRFGELKVDPHGVCSPVEYPRQEELYFVLEGAGVLHYREESLSLAPNDFTYVPPAAHHSVSNPSNRPLRLLVATVRIAPDMAISPVGNLVVANLGELQARTVEGHPDSVLYKLLIGPRSGMRDRINATYAVADFFLMDFAPGGTNFPHHHEVEEEVYLVLDGEGQIAAGSGTDGVAGLRPAKSGDAYYFRPNCTVGFYNQNKPGAKAHILALRTFVPIPKKSE
jgi:mannose-6-phosphate isomerase-like protein (cupin superfamily)